MNPPCSGVQGCERKSQWLKQDRNVIFLIFKPSSIGWAEGTRFLLAAGSTKPRRLPKMAARFPVSRVLHSRSKEDKRKRSQVEGSVISLERLLEAGRELLFTSKCLEG